MLMSQDLISSGVATRPRFGLSAKADKEIMASAEAAMRRRLCIDMLQLPGLGHAPGRDAIEMIDCFGAALGDELCARRLHIAAIVGRAALEEGRAASPAPRHTKARERHRQHGLLQCR